MKPPITPPATAAMKPAMIPSGSRAPVQGIVHQTCDQAHSAARPSVPMPTPAIAPKRIPLTGSVRRATASTTSASTT